MSEYARQNDIDAFVSKGGEGDKITVMMMPDEQRWRFADITPAMARQLADRLMRAAISIEKNLATLVLIQIALPILDLLT